MVGIVLTVLMITSFLSASAAADTIPEILEAFGLAGTWSPDCNKKLEHQGSVTNFIVLPSGEAKVVVKSGHLHVHGIFTAELDIAGAQKLAADKLHISYKNFRISFETAGGKTTNFGAPAFGSEMETTYLLWENKYRVVDEWAGQITFVKDGITYKAKDPKLSGDPSQYESTGKESGLVEKCGK